MYRDNCRATLVTDFDSVDECDDDDDRSSYISDYRNDDNNNSGGGGGDVSTSRSHDTGSCRVHEFGKFEENYGWVQCRSRSFPDHMYYYNTRSGCNTWCRPVSRYIDVPLTAISGANRTGDSLESANDLELMSISEDEEESERVSAGDDKSLIDASGTIARYYYISRMDLIPDDSTDMCFKMPLVKQKEKEEEEESEHFGVPLINQKEKEEKEEADMTYNDENNNVDDMKSDYVSLYTANFLKTEFFVGPSTKPIGRLANSCPSRGAVRGARRVYRVPRLKRIGPESQLIKPRRTRAPKSRETPGPSKIICEMYGVRTINYNPPDLSDICATMGVKMSTLSDSDSDSENNPANALPSPSRRPETTFKSKWRDIEKDIRPPLLSDSSSSPSSRSSTSSSTSSSSSSSTGSSSSSESSSGSSSCSCSSCSGKEA